jgi:peptidoglycan/LPS O-acetylase OafA/YrhL
MTYLPFIDGLRAVAILAVVAYHALPWALPGGFAGVDVFFVISGFLITRFVAEEIDAGTFSLSKFYVRRARRLLPAAIVCFSIVAVISAFILLPDAYWYFGRSLLSAALMYANIFFYHTGGYFSAPSLEKPLLHTWSLAVEDQFYLTWPILLLALAPRLPRPTLAAIAIGIAVASLAYAEYKISFDPEFAFFWLPTRAWELLTGAALALLAAQLMPSRAVANLLSISGFAALLASFALLSPEAHFPGLGALPACFGTAAIIASSLNQTTIVSRLLSLRPVVFVGLISYSLYLWHWPLIALTSYRLERPMTAAEACGVVSVSIAIAVLSWRYVEQPFRKTHGEHLEEAITLADRRFAGGAVLAIIAACCVALLIKIERGFPQRYEAGVRTALEQMVSGNPLRGACDNYQNIFSHDDVCNFGRKKSAAESYEVALFGDSMADQWTPLVAAFADEHHLAGRQVTNGGCALLFGIAIPASPAAKARECATYQEQAKKFIAANPKLKVAVISGFWEKWLARLEHPKWINDPLKSITLSPAAAYSAPHFDDVLEKTIKVFTSRGTKVVLIGQIPTYPVLPVRCVVASIENKADPAACGKTKDASEVELAASNAALDRAAKTLPGVSVSLPLNFMCDAERCSPLKSGIFFYKDSGHINRFGAVALRKFVDFPDVK